MGSDKAMLPFDGLTLLERARQSALVLGCGVFIVGPKERYETFGAVVEDIYKDCGPLSGIHAALSASQTELNIMLSVDMPLMNPQFLLWLLAEATSAREQILVPDVLGLQPLCAVYRREVRRSAEQLLKRGEYKISKLFSAVPTRYISEREVGGAGFSAEMFRNINTRVEYEQLTAKPDHTGLLEAKS